MPSSTTVGSRHPWHGTWHGKYSKSDHLLHGQWTFPPSCHHDTAWHVYRHVPPCLPPQCRPWAEAALAVTQDTDPSPAQPSPAQPSQRSAKWKWDNWSNAQSSGADTVQTQCKIVQIQCKQCEHTACLLGQSAVLRSSSVTKLRQWQWRTSPPLGSHHL